VQCVRSCHKWRVLQIGSRFDGTCLKIRKVIEMEISFSLAKHIPFQRRRRLNPEDSFFFDGNLHRMKSSKIKFPYFAHCLIVSLLVIKFIRRAASSIVHEDQSSPTIDRGISCGFEECQSITFANYYEYEAHYYRLAVSYSLHRTQICMLFWRAYMKLLATVAINNLLVQQFLTKTIML